MMGEISVARIVNYLSRIKTVLVIAVYLDKIKGAIVSSQLDSEFDLCNSIYLILFGQPLAYSATRTQKVLNTYLFNCQIKNWLCLKFSFNLKQFILLYNSSHYVCNMSHNILFWKKNKESYLVRINALKIHRISLYIIQFL